MRYHNFNLNQRSFALILPVLLGVSGCLYQSVPKHLTAPVEVSFDESANSLGTNQVIQADLWKSFNDPALTQLQQRVLAENRTLKQVASRLDAARAERGLAISALFPGVSVDTYRSSELPSKLNPTIPPTINKLNTFSAGFDSSWEVDLFGAVINGARAAQADLAGARADELAAKQALLAETAQAYFTLRADQAHLQNAQRRFDAANKLWTVTHDRLNTGRISAVDAVTVESQLATVRAALAPAQAQVTADINRLTVLTAWPQHTVAEIVGKTNQFPVVPPLVSVGNPTDWLARRPDVRSAEHQLRGSIARANVARSEYFPQVTLTGSYGYNAQTAKDIGTAASRQWTFGPSVNWNFLNFGQIYNQVRAANAASRAAAAQFDDTVLRALEETNNGFANYRAATQSLAQWQLAAAASAQQLSLTQERFKAGAVDLGVLLNTQLTDADHQDQLVVAQLRQASMLSALYRALAGDFASGTVEPAH